VLRLWNPALDSFDTLRLGDPPTPPPPPPHPHPPPGPPAPVPPGWAELKNHSGTFCCDQSACKDGGSSFLFSGSAPLDKCIAKCLADPRCEFVTSSSDGWCMNAQWCNTTAPFRNGAARTFRRPPAWASAAKPPPSPPPPHLAGVSCHGRCHLLLLLKMTAISLRSGARAGVALFALVLPSRPARECQQLRIVVADGFRRGGARCTVRPANSREESSRLLLRRRLLPLGRAGKKD